MMRIFIGCLFVMSVGEIFAQDPAHQLLIERIQPLGAVRVEGEATQIVEPSVPKKSVKTRTGAQIYKQYCSVCHATGVAGAPKFRDGRDWQDRLAQGMDSFIQHVENGLNAMPPKGTCMDCTKDDFKRSIEYMLPQ